MGGGGRGGAYLTDVGREANSKWQEKNGHDIQHVSVQLELAARCKQRIKKWRVANRVSKVYEVQSQIWKICKVYEV